VPRGTRSDSIARSIGKPARSDADASVVVVSYRAGAALIRLLDSLADQPGLREVVIVDNGGGGREIEEARGRDGVQVVEAGRNLGFAAGCNLGARHAGGGVLVFLNPDTVAARSSIAQLVRTLEDPRIGIAMARLRLLNQPELLNSSGIEVHVSGIAWAGGYGDPVESLSELREVTAPSGTAMAIRGETFMALGGFTEELFMYQEDLLLGWRARLAGLQVVINPEADVYHDYEFSRNDAKYYLLERNRLVFLFSTFSPRLLLLLSPVLISTELAMAALAAREGWFRAKLRGWTWCVQHARWLLRERRKTQRLRRVSDRELARLLSPVLTPKMIPIPGPIRAANPVVAAYWRLARRAL
jgi:GT2 family glycosyltransferase